MANTTGKPIIDANALEAIAKERPNEKFLKGSGVLKLIQAIRDLERANRQLQAEQPIQIKNLRKALQFYADGHHFTKSDGDAWDTVSGEPQNYWCDEAGTATVEDGSIAKLALAGHPIKFEDEDAPAQPETPHQVATQPTAPSMTLPAERSLFKEQFRHLDLEEMPDAWGRPVFKHSHVDAIWHGWRQRAAIALLDTYTRPSPTAQAAPDLHPKTADLVRRFSAALAEKLAAAEKKYGYSDGWASPGWMDECRQHLNAHIAKGDPRDVAAYCAFLWHHGASTAAPAADYDHGPQSVTVAEAARHVGKWLNERPNRPLDLRDVAMLCAHAQKAPAAGAVAGPVYRIRNKKSVNQNWAQVSEREYRDALTMPMQFDCEEVAAPTPAAQADSQPAQCHYSIDADPQGIRSRVAEAITGALAFGAQGENPPPEEHWLAPFWNAARADRSQADSALKDAALLDWQASARVEVSPEYEGPWHAAAFGEDEKPVFLASGNTPREALIAARSKEVRDGR